MRRFGLLHPVALVLSLSLAGCGGDDDPAGTGGAGGSTGGTSGGGSGGTAGGGSGDQTAPDFSGATSATAKSETRIELVWDAANDETSPASRIAYAVYASTTPGGQDFTKPLSISPAGATGALMSGLDPSSTYHFVVRARDEAGNEDANATERSASTPDQSEPRFAGVTKLNAKTSRSLLVEWKPARDKGSNEAEISYRVYVATATGEQNFATPTFETAPGETSALIKTGVDPLTDYYVVVRAVDADGNTEDNIVELTTKTPEGVPPAFLGVRQIIAQPEGIKLYWTPATDIVTEQANIVYEIYQATAAAGEKFDTPTYVTEPAAISYLVTGLTPGQRYYYIVRARDSAGNVDGNTVEVTARAIGDEDKTAPNFAGVTSVTGTSPSTLLASWSAADDDQTAPGRIVYDVYVSDTSGAQSFATPSLTTTGATSIVIAGLPPQATRYVVVRARDESGNFTQNLVEQSGATLANPSADTTAPTWGSGPNLVAPNGQPFRLDVSVGAASDNTYAAADIRYHVCAEPIENDCLGAQFTKHIRATTGWGATSVNLTGLLSRTRYFVYARAEDRSGNLETGNHGDSETTATSYVADILPFLRDRCNSCHNFSHLRLVDVPGGYVDPIYGAIKLVDPGDPELSLLYRKVNPLGYQVAPFSAGTPNTYSGSQEPRDGSGLSFTPLSGAEDGAIRDWILQGASSN
jgi:hypothetical protein